MKTLVKKIEILGLIVVIEKHDAGANMLTEEKERDYFTAKILKENGQIQMMGTGFDSIEAVNSLTDNINGAILSKLHTIEPFDSL